MALELLREYFQLEEKISREGWKLQHIASLIDLGNRIFQRASSFTEDDLLDYIMLEELYVNVPAVLQEGMKLLQVEEGNPCPIDFVLLEETVPLKREDNSLVCPYHGVLYQGQRNTWTYTADLEEGELAEFTLHPTEDDLKAWLNAYKQAIEYGNEYGQQKWLKYWQRIYNNWLKKVKKLFGSIENLKTFLKWRAVTTWGWGQFRTWEDVVDYLRNALEEAESALQEYQSLPQSLREKEREEAQVATYLPGTQEKNRWLKAINAAKHLLSAIETLIDWGHVSGAAYKVFLDEGETLQDLVALWRQYRAKTIRKWLKRLIKNMLMSHSLNKLHKNLP